MKTHQTKKKASLKKWAVIAEFPIMQKCKFSRPRSNHKKKIKKIFLILLVADDDQMKTAPEGVTKVILIFIKKYSQCEMFSSVYYFLPLCTPYYFLLLTTTILKCNI